MSSEPPTASTGPVTSTAEPDQTATSAPAAKKETALQRETRLTGNADLISFVNGELQRAYRLSQPNMPLARKIVGRFCHAKSTQDFHRRIKDYIVGDQISALALHTAIDKYLKTLEEHGSGVAAGGSSSVLEGTWPASSSSAVPGGLLQVKRKLHQQNVAAAGSEKDVLYVRPGSTLGLDRLAQQKRAEQAGKSSSMMLMSPNLDGDEEDDGPNLLFSAPKKAAEPREIDKFLSDHAADHGRTKQVGGLVGREDADDEDVSLFDADGRRREKQTGGGVRVFRGNKTAVMAVNDDSVMAKKVLGLQHDVLDEDFQEKIMHEVEMDEFDDMEMDRQWYDADESGMSGGSSLTYGSTMDAAELFEKEQDLKKNAEQVFQKKLSLAQQERNVNTERWEDNQMRIAGFGERKEIDLDSFRLLNEGRTQHVVVSETVPPFLDGRVSYTTQQDPVSVVKDITSDLAVLAKKGSDSVKRVREEGDKHKMRDRFWEVQNSAMGALIGASDKQKSADGTDNAPGPAADQEIDGLADKDYNYKKDNQFADAMKNVAARGVFGGKERTIDEVRMALPVYHVKDEIMDLLREHQVLIAVGETGSGKTTQLTQYLYEKGYASGDAIIGCTQPRRMAAMSVAKRVADERKCELGDLVGYSIRFEDCTSPETKIKYMTDGVLLRETLQDKDLEKYSCVIMDEAHERGLNTDVLFGILKNVVVRRRDFRLIVTSATMDSEKFSQFFGSVPVFKIPGRTFPVDTFFSKSAAQDYVKEAVHQAIQVHVSQPRGDILIFMTGQEDIDTTCLLLADKLIEVGENVEPLNILPVYSTMPADLQARIFQPSPYRKAIVATNIAETSLTVDGVKYVIDTGFCKLKVYDPKVGMDSLQITPISQANANQRRGRAGRTEAGACWRLYTERAYVVRRGSSLGRGDFSWITLPSSLRGIFHLRRPRCTTLRRPRCTTLFHLHHDSLFSSPYSTLLRGIFHLHHDSPQAEMHENTIPEIQRTNLSQVVLLLKSLGIDNLLQFDFMDPPPQETIINSMYQLWMLGALDNLGNLTDAGRKMSDFPVDPPLAKMILSAVNLKCVTEILVVIAMINGATSIFFRPKERADEADAAKEKFSVSESDHLTLLNVYQQWKRNGYSASWCGSHYLQAKGLKRVRETCSQLTDITSQHKIPLSSCGGDWDSLRKAVCSGYFHNASKMRGIGEYINLRSNIPCHLHPTSALYGLGYTPDYVVYHEVILTTKEYMQQVTAVEPAWLAEMGPMFFSVRETGTDVAALRRQDAENQRKMEYEAQLESDRLAAELKTQREREEMVASSKQQVASFGRKRGGREGVGGVGGSSAGEQDPRGEAKRKRDEAVVKDVLSIGGGMGEDDQEQVRRKRQEDSSDDEGVSRNRRTAGGAQVGKKRKKMVIGGGSK